jgi:hypothetical protein
VGDVANPARRHHRRQATLRLGGVNSRIVNEFMSTGAVITGRGTFEAAGGWGGDHHDGVPIYVLSRNPAPAWAAEWPAVQYVSDPPSLPRPTFATFADIGHLLSLTEPRQ